MNELDYVRDNRLRLWFIERSQRSMKFSVDRFLSWMTDLCGSLTTVFRAATTR